MPTNMFTAGTTVLKSGGVVHNIQCQDNSIWQGPCGSKGACHQESRGRGTAICEWVSTLIWCVL